MCNILVLISFPDFENDNYASSRAKAGSINAKTSVQIKAESSGGSAKPSPMLEAGFMQHLCLKCRANYLQFKDLASKGEETFQMVTSQSIKAPKQEYGKIKKRSMAESPRSQHFHPYPYNRWVRELENEKVVRESSPQRE